MPSPRTVPASHNLAKISFDSLADLLQHMGEVGRNNYQPSRISAAFSEAVRRNILTADEADAGVKACLRVPIRKQDFAGFPG